MRRRRPWSQSAKYFILAFIATAVRRIAPKAAESQTWTLDETRGSSSDMHVVLVLLVHTWRSSRVEDSRHAPVCKWKWLKARTKRFHNLCYVVPRGRTRINSGIRVDSLSVC